MPPKPWIAAGERTTAARGRTPTSSCPRPIARAPCRAADLERLATAALLIGREKEFERTQERAHRKYRDAGDRPSAARCAFWIGLLLFLRGATGPATGWHGLRSLVSRAVNAERYHEKPPLLAAYYSYWSGLPMAGRFESYTRPHRGFAPVADQRRPHAGHRRLAVLGVRVEQGDIEGNLRGGDRPECRASRIAFGKARREERFAGMPVPGYFRKPFGPGWALVAKPDTTRTSSRPRGSRTDSGTPSCASGRWTTLSGPALLPGGHGRVSSHSRRARAADVRAHRERSPRLEPPPPGAARVPPGGPTGTRTRWTASPASTRGSPPPGSSSPRRTSQRIFAAAR